MTKISKNSLQKNTEFEARFNKLAQPRNPNFEYTVKSLGKRAKAKYFTNSYTTKLASLKTPLQKSYNNTIFGCSNILIQSENKLTSLYCNNRWCIVCNRIRTAKLINGYKEPLENLNDKFFVTLTIPNVYGEDLRNTIKEMIKKFGDIKNLFSHKKLKFIGLRKLECTYNPILNNYHPHFHLIVNGKEQAEKLVYEWLKRYPEAQRIAQDIRSSDNGTMMELFKYFSKIISNNAVYVTALDVIFQAMRKLRVYQPFGIQKTSEEIEELQAEIITDLVQAEKYWTWIDTDWIDTETGECLTQYTPDERMKALISKITY